MANAQVRALNKKTKFDNTGIGTSQSLQLFVDGGEEEGRGDCVSNTIFTYLFTKMMIWS